MSIGAGGDGTGTGGDFGIDVRELGGLCVSELRLRDHRKVPSPSACWKPAPLALGGPLASFLDFHAFVVPFSRRRAAPVIFPPKAMCSVSLAI